MFKHYALLLTLFKPFPCMPLVSRRAKRRSLIEESILQDNGCTVHYKALTMNSSFSAVHWHKPCERMIPDSFPVLPALHASVAMCNSRLTA